MTHYERRSRSRSRDREHQPARSFPAVTGAAVATNSILLAQQAAQDKINRELFVGNTPPGTSEMLLLQFFNAAMRRVKLCPPTASPVVQCRVSAKFAFVECATIQDANNCLNLSGIPFLGSSLKVSRPSKYNGPFVPSKTWQELTGQALPSGVVDPNEEKLNRELFIGNTTPEMTGEMLMDFLGKAMEQVGLTILPGNPINACRVNGKFAFIELRTVKETENALNLNNIPFMGAMLRVGRPSKYNGPLTKHGNWEDILAKYMSGELVLPNQSGGNSSTAATAAATTAQSAENVGFTSRVVELKNMLTLGDLENDEEYQDIMEDTKDECSQFGSLKSVIIPRSGPGATKIFLEYLTKEDAAKAITGLAGRTFDGRKVLAAFFSEDKFASKDYS